MDSDNLNLVDDLNTQEFTINMGPYHPSTHGVFRAVLTLDGEVIVKEENVLGYLHRGMDKIAETRTYSQFVPYTARLDYLASALNNMGYVQTVEKLMGIEVPERAEYLRVIIAELQRIASHYLMLGSTTNDVNAVTGFLYYMHDREKVLDLLEMVTGARLTSNYMRIGGVIDDLPEEFFPKVKEFLAYLPGRLEMMETLILGNEIFQERMKNVGVITAQMALDYGVTGPNLRAAGVRFDLRKVAPYSAYGKIDFEVPVLKNGDAFDRYQIRLMEIKQSLRIIEQAVQQLPEGPIMAKVPKLIKPPAGEVFHKMEGARGILGFHLVSDGGPKPYRLHIHGPSFVNIGIMPAIAPGMLLQDFLAAFATIDVDMGEVDR
jgi:NADH-quinone oxidoreductase subunit D